MDQYTTKPIVDILYFIFCKKQREVVDKKIKTMWGNLLPTK
jgi:hypothetical protein